MERKCRRQLPKPTKYNMSSGTADTSVLDLVTKNTGESTYSVFLPNTVMKYC